MSVIVATLNEGAELAATIESLLAGRAVPAEIVIVDDGGNDGSVDALDLPEWRSRGVLVHRVKRMGVAAARNLGARIASGPLLVFLDAHCRLDADCLGLLAEAARRRPEAILAPSIRDIGAVEDDSRADRPDATGGGAEGCGAELIGPDLRIRWLPPRTDSSLYQVPIAPGGCLAVHRDTFDRLDGFGRFRQLGLEDVELSLRAWRAGIDVLAVPEARLRHLFRERPPYLLDPAARAYNVARVALSHFEGARREECLRRLIGTPMAATALVDALCSDEESCKPDGGFERSMADYFRTFGDWRE